MAHIEDRWKREDRKGTGKRWRVRYNKPDGREASESFTRRVDAQRFKVEVEADLQRRVWTDPKRGQQLVCEYAQAKFLPSLVHLRPNSMSTYSSHLRTHILPLLGDRRMGSLEKSDVRAFVAAKTAELAPSTVETVFAVLRAMMTAAVEDKVITVNPCTRVKLPPVEPRVLVPLEAAHVLLIADAVPQRYRVSVALAAAAGLRFGEATGLTVQRVESLRRRIRVLEQAQNGALAPLKSKASKRDLPAGDWVLDEVALHLQVFGPGQLHTVMSNAAGRLVARNAFGDMWRRTVAAVRTCGKKPSRAGAAAECRETCADPAHMLTGTRYHDLRHFYASALIDAGMNPKVVQTRLGHATIAETMDTYGHLFKDSEDAGRMSVDDALGKARTAPARPRSVQ